MGGVRTLPLFVTSTVLDTCGQILIGMVVIWLTLTRTGDVSLMAVAALLSVLPYLVSLLFGGRVSVGRSQRRVAVAAGVFSCVMVVAVAMVDRVGTLGAGWLLALAAATGVAGSVGLDARDAVRHHLAAQPWREEDEVETGAAAAVALAGLIVPLVGGFLISLWGEIPILWVVAACYGGSAVAMAAVPLLGTVGPRPSRELLRGVLTVNQVPGMARLMGVDFLAGVLLGVATVTVPAFFHPLAPSLWGLATMLELLALVLGVGVLELGLQRRKLTVLWVALALATVGCVLLGGLGGVWPVMIGLVLVCLAGSALGALADDVIQASFRERWDNETVEGIDALVKMTGVAVGMVLMAVVLLHWSVAAGLWLMLAVWVPGAAWALLSPDLRKLLTRQDPEGGAVAASVPR